MQNVFNDWIPLAQDNISPSLDELIIVIREINTYKHHRAHKKIVTLCL